MLWEPGVFRLASTQSLLVRDGGGGYCIRLVYHLICNGAVNGTALYDHIWYICSKWWVRYCNTTDISSSSQYQSEWQSSKSQSCVGLKLWEQQEILWEDIVRPCKNCRDTRKRHHCERLSTGARVGPHVSMHAFTDEPWISELNFTFGFQFPARRETASNKKTSLCICKWCLEITQVQQW